MKKPLPSLTRRALAIFICAVILSGILGGFLVNYYSEQFLQDISGRNLDLAYHVMGGVKVFLQHHAAELLELRLLIHKHGIQESEFLRDELDRINAFHPLLQQVQILDPEGSIVQVSPFDEEYIGIDMSSHESYQNALKLSGNEVYWSDSFLSTQTDNPAVTISLLLKNGVLMAHLSLEALSDLIGFTQPVDGEVTAITDRRGVVIAHPSREVVRQRVNWMNLDSIRSGTAKRVGTYREVRNEVPGLASVVRLEESGWVVSVFQPEKVALGVLYHARRVVAVTFILLLILTMLTLLALMRKGVQPFKRLEEKADMIAAGRYGEDLNAEYVELSGFVESFNAMTAAVRRREEELTSSEERFRILFDEAAEPTYHMNEKGDLIAANRRAEKALGYTSEEFSHMNVSDFIVDQDRPIVSSRLAAIGKGEAVNAEAEHQRKDGTIFPVEVRIARMEVDGEDRYIAHARDVSERKSAEQALKASEERFRATFITSPEAVSINRLKDGRYEDINEGFCSITGFHRDEVIGRTSLELGIWADPEARESFLEKLLQEGKCDNLEIEFRIKDGRILTGLLSATLITFGGEPHVLSITRDITQLKEAQSSLKEAYHLLSTIIDSSPLGIVQTDRDGIIHLWNPAAEKIFGWQSDEVMNKPAPTIPEEKKDEFRDLYRRILEGEYIYGIETQRKRKDGANVDVSISLARIVLETGEVEVMGIVEDITERKAAEKALIESEERFRKISDGMQEGIVFSRSGVIIDVNEQMSEIFGYSSEELIDKPILDFIHSEWKENVKRMLVEGKEEQYELVCMKKDGSPITVQVKGTRTTYKGSLACVMSIVDLTGIRRAEAVLREREKRYRLLYENNPLSYQSLDADGIIREVNSAWIRMTGYKADEVIGRPFIDFISEDYKDVVRQNFPVLLKKGEIQVPIIEIVTQEGRRIHVMLFGKASIDEETGLMKTHCLLNDITEPRRMEEALKKSAQLAAVGQVASGIAHEINNPLATISASTEALLSRLAELRKDVGTKKKTDITIDLFQEYLTMIMEEVNRSSQIIRDLLDITRVREYSFSEVKMDDLIHSTVRLLSVQSRMSKHSFEVEVPPDLPQLKGDRDRLMQVVIILLTNAFEATPEGGTISIKCSFNRKQRTVSVSIVDTGAGVSKDKMAHIFEPFYTTKESGSGTGLGLSIADQIVTRHDGRIEVTSRHGEGATFTVILPLDGPVQTDETRRGIQ